jgi:hypothetical protein
MGSEDTALYVMRGDDEEDWVHPTPAATAIVDAVTGATDLDESEIDDAGSYVDWDDLSALLDGEGGEELTFAVEGHEVTVSADGTIAVAD